MSMREPDILTVALMGVQHSGQTAATTGTPVDQLPRTGAGAERDLLLRAGAWAIYRRAGYLPAFAQQLPEPAPAESRPICSPGASALLETLLAGQPIHLLSEALARLNALGLRLPPTLLPVALARAPATLRPALAPALGERGRWLGQFNPAWRWAAETLDDAADPPSNAEELWEEGAPGQRVEILRRLRRRDSARAREWLAEVWKREKAETRAALLATLAVSLALEDESLLTTALADRAERVRGAAADLLLRLPESAFAQRACQRAAAALVFKDGTLDAEPFDEDDGWVADAERGAPRNLLLMRAIGRVPPEHWEAVFTAAPDTLIAAASESFWGATILLGWTSAVARFGSARWALPLWRCWLAAPNTTLQELSVSRSSLGADLAAYVPAAELDAFALSLLADPTAHADITLHAGLDLLPHPWSAAVASAYLEGLRAFGASLIPESTSAEPWEATLRNAALALPASHFAQALEPLTLPDGLRWQVAAFGRSLDAFGASIDLRARMVKELPL